MYNRAIMFIRGLSFRLRGNGKNAFGHLFCLLVYIFVFSLLMGGVVASAADKSLLESMDPAKRGEFSELLAELKMFELSNQLVKDSADLSLNAQELVSRADAINPKGDPEKLKTQNQLYAKAVELIAGKRSALAKKIQEGPGESLESQTAHEETILRYFENTIQLLNVQVLNRGKDSFDAIIFQFPRKGARKNLRALTEPALAWLKQDENKLIDQIRGTDDMLLKMDLGKTRTRLDYIGGLVRYYAALGLAGVEEQAEQCKTLLNLASNTLQQLAEKKDFNGRQIARLYAARACREMGDYSGAEAHFDTAMKLKSLQMEAMYDTVRNYYQWGASLVRQGKLNDAKSRYQSSQEFLKKFLSNAPSSKDLKLGHDIKGLILELKMYLGWSDALKKLDKKKGGNNKNLQQQATQKEKQAIAAFEEFTRSHDAQGIIRVLLKLLPPEILEGENAPPQIKVYIAALKVDKIEELINNNKPLSAQHRQQIEKLQAEAEKLFAGIGEDAKAYPDVLWQSGRIAWLNRENIKAADLFHALASKFPKRENAEKAANIALQLINGIITKLYIEKDKNIPSTIRTKLEKILWTYLDGWCRTPEKRKEQDIDLYWMQLGETCEEIAEELAQTDRSKSLEYRRRAEDAYSMVPEGSDYYTSARYRMLVGSAKRMLARSVKEIKQEEESARKLVGDLTALGESTRKRWNPPGGAGPRNNLMGEQGARSEFYAHRLKLILAEAGGTEETVVLDKLKSMRERWPGTSVLIDIESYLIRKLLDAGKMKDAVAMFDQFRKNYPEQAEYLLYDIVDKIKGKIDYLTNKKLRSPTEESELKSLRENYVRFARDYFEANYEKADDTQKIIDMILLYGDALWKSGQRESAELAREKLFPLVEEIMAPAREKWEQETEDEVKQLVAKVEAAPPDIAAIEGLVTDFVTYLSDRGLLSEDIGENIPAEYAEKIRLMESAQWHAAQLTYLCLALKEAKRTEGEKQKEHCTDAKKKFVAVYQKIEDFLKNNMPGNLDVLTFKARTLWGCGEHSEAMDLYDNIKNRIDRAQFPDRYWEIVVERYRCAFDGFKNDPQSMKNLAAQITALLKQNPDMSPKFTSPLRIILDDAERKAD